MFTQSRFLRLLIVLAVLAAGEVVWGQSAWYEGFEEADASWREAGGDVRYKVLDHRRTGGAHTGQGCEWYRVSADGGTALYVAHDVGQPRVIEELLPTVWVKSDRPGLSISARVILPRTMDPRTNKPAVRLIPGDTMYNDVGRWQQLRVADMPMLLTRQIRALHEELGPNVDGREAYVDAILLNIYGGPGVTNVWIDDLDVAGHVGSNRTPGQVVASLPRNGPPAVNGLGGMPFAPANQPKRFEIKLSVSGLTVDGKSIFPRAIEHQGEPLPLLKQLGFNAVWLKRLPTPEILEEADRLGLWLVSPPPRPTQSDGRDDPAGAMNPIGPAFDRVLIWDLGYDLTPEQLPAVRRWADGLRSADHRGQRPLICKPQSNLRGYSQLGNNNMLLLVDRRPLGTSMEFKDYGTWVSRQPLMALPGTPMWTTVQTQPNEALRSQIAALDPNAPPPGTVSFEQMRLLTANAVASGSRGLMFLSSTPLDAPDADTRQRAMALELLNLELALVEPWAAAGSPWASADHCSEPQVTGTVLRAERGRLLLPIWSAPGGQCVPGESAVNRLSLVVPGVPEESDAYELTPGGLNRLPNLRVDGGLRVTFQEFSLTSQVLLAHDPLIINGLMRRSENIGQRAARLSRDLAVDKYYRVQAAMKRLGQPPASAKQLGAWFDAANKSLQSCDGQLNGRDYSGATLSADRAMRPLRLIERFYWDAAVRGLVSPVTSPAAVTFETLPLHAGLLARIRGPRSQNLLPGGDFDDPGTTVQAGWRNILSVPPGGEPASSLVQPSADITWDSKHSGLRGLQLKATATTPETAPAMIENPPVRFISPSIPVEPGQLVCIHGWVKVEEPITGSVDGLMIYDNQAGEALADRIGQTADWRQFALYRVVTQSGGVNVTFSLTGLGIAWIDDVAIEVLGVR